MKLSVSSARYRFAFLIGVGLVASAVLVGGTVPSSFAASATPKPKVATKAKSAAGAKSSAKPTVKITIAPKAPSGVVNGGGRFTNLTSTQRSCLSKNGLTLPKPGAARPTSNPTRPATGVNRGNFDPTKMAKAYKACKIALPTGAPGGFNRDGGAGFDQVKFQAFQTCMTKAGIKSTGGFGQFDQSDPDTAIALIKCQKSTGFTMPTRTGQGVNN
ncbi:unannotated protein [freshwater metagenome]|uniref:Unannotated protein n=1 Tax=freshwater metagenome TaxID=449393 RepID=A0A6J7BE57_9ZZZZ|nr:hypothetical protein [Actinomycetota bacterium]